MKKTIALLMTAVMALSAPAGVLAEEWEDIAISEETYEEPSEEEAYEEPIEAVEVESIIPETRIDDEAPGNLTDEGNTDEVSSENTPPAQDISPESDELVIESIEEYSEPEPESNLPITLAVEYFNESLYIGESTSFWIYLTENSSITLVSDDDSIANASVTGTKINASSSGNTYGRQITINGYKEGTTSINIMRGSTTLGIINVEVLVETESIGTQHVNSTYTTTVVSNYEQNYSVDTDAVSINSISTSKKMSSTTINGVTTTTVTYTSTIVLSLNKAGNYDFNIVGSMTGRMKNYTANVEDHIWNDYYTVDVEPTTTSEGSESIHCSVCDEINPDTVTVLPMKEKTDISECTIELDSSTFIYDGTEKTPGVTIYDGSTKLTGSDYEVSYSDNIDAGTATVKITASGDYYRGETEKTFIIEQADISECAITLAETQYVYDGTEKMPAVTEVRDSSRVLTEEDYSVSYSNNISAGIATVTITGMGNYTGTAAVTFEILGIDISDAEVTLSTSDYIYDGSSKEPSVTVVLEDTTLTDGIDYFVEYSDNINAGTATVTVTGKGNYAGELSYTFEIEQQEITADQFAVDTGSEVYTGSAITKEIVTELSEGTDYTVSYKDNTNVGTATITITGIGNYAGELSYTFEIEQQEITADLFAVDTGSEVYTGSAITKKIVTELSEGTDYTVSYSDNTNVGVATITITGIGNYVGELSYTFEIKLQQEITADLFAVDTGSEVYTGSAITKEIVTELSEGKDYTVSYSDNTNAGVATITITGIGNYAGKLTYKFTILEAEFSKGSVAAEGYSGTYDGKNHSIRVSLLGNAKGAAVTYSTEEDGTYSTENPSYVAAGTYVVYYKVSKANYKETTGYAAVEITEEPAEESKSTTRKLILLATDDANGRSVTLNWNRVKEADGYIIYGARCGKTLRELATVEGNTNKTYKVTGLKKTTGYKFRVLAYNTVNGEKQTLCGSNKAHVATAGGKYTNVKKLKVSDETVSLRVGGSRTVSATYTLIDPSKKLAKHMRKIRFKSSDKSVAKVDINGEIRGIGEGTCYVYAYGSNGVYKKIVVNVK